MRKPLISADPGERQWPIGVAPQALPILAEILDGGHGGDLLLGALQDEMPGALARGQAEDWARAGHAIIDLLAGLIEHRIASGRET